MPFHLIEGFYARLVENAPDVATANIQFGYSRLDIDIFIAAEASLSSEFEIVHCNVDEFVRRVEVEAARPRRTAVVAYARHYVPLEPFLFGENVGDIWISDLETATLVDSSGRLAPYTDLALLVGPHSFRVARLLSTPSQYTSAMFRLVSAVCLLDGDIAMPAARLAVPAVPAVPAIDIGVEAVAETPSLGLSVCPQCPPFRRRRFRRQFTMTTSASALEIGCVRSRFRLNCFVNRFQLAMFGWRCKRGNISWTTRAASTSYGLALAR